MPKKLLLAEDSLTIQKVFELAFAQSDVAITAVDNGEDAVRLAGEIVPDLVVADVTLPGKDGYAVAAELRAAEKTRDIPVLILSGSLIPLDEQRFRTSRASAVLLKPFDSQELMEKVEGLLRKDKEVEGPAAAVMVAAGQPPADEHWDFSDVLEEVEEEAGKGVTADVPAAPLKREEILPGALLPGGGGAAGVSLNEFDVSVEEIEGGQAREEPAAPPPQPETHLEWTIAGDAPPAVTDLAPALEPEEEIEDIEELEEVEFPPEATQPAESPAAPQPTAHVTPAASPPAEDGTVLGAAFQEQFSARAEEIFRAVATEAVEKVMWEMMDRLAADFSAKVRESVEAVAWEVIPATAEALIREEISRIRQQAGKLSS
ncbi:MAG: response regulator receiver protein [Deltaproteobacteria bacterium]|jgi:CheY-like chemotaxis protein|nr:response regulator receiver protein [Deltaproteobacteria bacterium]